MVASSANVGWFCLGGGLGLIYIAQQTWRLAKVVHQLHNGSHHPPILAILWLGGVSGYIGLVAVVLAMGALLLLGVVVTTHLPWDLRTLLKTALAGALFGWIVVSWIGVKLIERFAHPRHWRQKQSSQSPSPSASEWARLTHARKLLERFGSQFAWYSVWLAFPAILFLAFATNVAIDLMKHHGG